MIHLFALSFLNWWQVMALRLVIRGGGISMITVVDASQEATIHLFGPPPEPPRPPAGSSPVERLERCLQMPPHQH